MRHSTLICLCDNLSFNTIVAKIIKDMENHKKIFVNILFLKFLRQKLVQVNVKKI